MFRRNSIVFHLTLMDVFGVYCDRATCSVTDPCAQPRLLCGRCSRHRAHGFGRHAQDVMLRHVRLMHVRLMAGPEVAFRLAVLFITWSVASSAPSTGTSGSAGGAAAVGDADGRGGCHRCGRRHWCWGCHGRGRHNGGRLNRRDWSGQFRLNFRRGSRLPRGRFGNGYDIVVLRGEESFTRPQLFAGQRHTAAGGTAGGVVVDRAHSCSPLLEESGSLPEAARSVGALLGFSDCAGACTRRPTSVPLAFCMSIACCSIPAAAT